MSTVRLQLAEQAPRTIALKRSAHADHLTGVVGLEVREVELLRLIAGRGVMRVHGRILRFRMAMQGGEVRCWVAGDMYAMRLVDKHENRRPRVTTGAKKELTAPMPGTILRIPIRKGSAFQAHEPIIIMESMKMELTLSSPAAGTVREMRCSEGELVPLGHVLARLDLVDES